MKLQLACSNEQNEIEISDKWVEELETILQIAGSLENISSGEVTLTFVDDQTIHQLNKDYRNIDRPTDVLSFAMQESSNEETEIFFDEDMDIDEISNDMLGDIIISVSTAKKQSKEYEHSLQREIGFLFVHGFLHLIGYDHQDEQSEKEMFDKQEAILQEAGLTR
ncbi:rRNA maturation RNase YbeY [Chengkuizengella axinellae]|uniref:Endoribonuclease YbeY n=1 Tax=Chengkuizengella axinellae TaxID=3064388 RepID=A0ABT9IUV4_9BACL|nr:rRNA maturation RNase YbeY [Chengkuizengella sp. 2205SS18-9]MDP5273097.1 rRNA maturation RNase YbeY [Chengkuizengella sp. 2205SS18-9]